MVKNETENAVRQAEYEAAKRKYEQDKQEHAKQMAERKRRGKQRRKSRRGNSRLPLRHPHRPRCSRCQEPLAPRLHK